MNATDDSVIRQRLVARLGTGLLAAASVLAILIFADRTGAELFDMPRWWYETRSLHLLVCVVLFLFAAALLKSPADATGSENRFNPSEPLFESVRFFTRQQCPLCDEALETLSRYAGWLGTVEVIDVDRQPEFRRLFGESVPVLEVDGRVRFRGGVPSPLLERLILGTQLQQQAGCRSAVVGR